MRGPPRWRLPLRPPQSCSGKTRFALANAYSEDAHIRPLGRPHNGPDQPDNVLCLCPNHHVLFDAGAFAIHPDTLELVGIVGKLRTHRRHPVGREHLEYRMGHFLAGAPALSAERS